MFVDVHQQFLSLKFFTGTSEINGLEEGNWADANDNLGSKTFRIEDSASLKQAVEFALTAYKIACDWSAN